MNSRGETSELGGREYPTRSEQSRGLKREALRSRTQSSERKLKLRDLPPIRLFTGRQRARLMRDYFLISVLLVGGGLTTSGLIEIYFRYQREPTASGPFAA